MQHSFESTVFRRPEDDMAFNLVAAIAAGLVGTAVITGVMMMAPRMGMPRMDIPALLGSMFGAPGNKTLVMGMLPALHAGMRSGAVAAPGVYMLQAGGVMSFIGGLMGHVIFGLVVGLVYGFVAGRLGG